MKLNKREKTLLILSIILGMILFGKSLIEGYKLTETTSASEVEFYEWVQQQQVEEYSSGLYENGVFSIKLISIIEREQDGGVYYVAKLRKYLLKVVPFSDVYIKEEKVKFLEQEVE